MATTLTAENKTFQPLAWENVSCPFCDAMKFKTYERFGYQLKFTYVRCDECTLVYQNPRPKYDMEFVETAYEVYVVEDKNEFYNESTLLPGGQKMLADSDHVISKIEDYVPGKGRLLDIGSHIGLLCKAANDRGWTATGADVSGTMVATAKKRFGVDARLGDWTEMGFGREFDAITCNHVIEHIPDPGAWLQHMKQILKPGGVICISVPNVDSIDNVVKHKLKELGLKKPSEWAAWRTPDHLVEPNETSFRRLAERCGLDVLKVETYSNKSFGNSGLFAKLYNDRFRLGSKLRFFLGVRQS